MKPTIHITFLISSLFLMKGCAYIEYTGQWPPSDSMPHPNEQIYIEPNKSSFTSGEQITGIFKNNTVDVLYIFFPNGGSDHPLQKWNGKKWEKINTSRKGAYHTQAVRLIPLERGKVRRVHFPEKRLIEMGMEIKGIYRFSFTITPEKGTGNNTTIHSREFIIE